MKANAAYSEFVWSFCLTQEAATVRLWTLRARTQSLCGPGDKPPPNRRETILPLWNILSFLEKQTVIRFRQITGTPRKDNRRNQIKTRWRDGRASIQIGSAQEQRVSTSPRLEKTQNSAGLVTRFSAQLLWHASNDSGSFPVIIVRLLWTQCAWERRDMEGIGFLNTGNKWCEILCHHSKHAISSKRTAIISYDWRLSPERMEPPCLLHYSLSEPTLPPVPAHIRTRFGLRVLGRSFVIPLFSPYKASTVVVYELYN